MPSLCHIVFRFHFSLITAGIVITPVYVLCQTYQSNPTLMEVLPNIIPESITLADLHNSSLHFMYQCNQPNLDFFHTHIKSNQILFMSLGISRFDMMHPDTATIMGVLDFFRNLKNNSIKDSSFFSFPENRIQMISALKANKTCIILALEGTWLFQGDINWIDSLNQIGIKAITIAHRFHDEFITTAEIDANDTLSSNSGRSPSILNYNSSLSQLGISLIKKILQLKILIDVSHLGETAFWEVIQLNSNDKPIIASHSNSKSLCNNERNLSDAQLKAIANTGGLVGICFHSPMLKDSGAAFLSDIVDHIQYAVKVMGSDHVAIGTDIGGRIQLPLGISETDYVKELIEEMLRRGMSNKTIAKIMSENVFRLTSWLLSSD